MKLHPFEYLQIFQDGKCNGELKVAGKQEAVPDKQRENLPALGMQSRF